MAAAVNNAKADGEDGGVTRWVAALCVERGYCRECSRRVSRMCVVELLPP